MSFLIKALLDASPSIEIEDELENKELFPKNSSIPFLLINA